MENLPNDTETLHSIIQKLVEEITQLKAENAELRRRLGLDSTNSHKPPSSDGYQKKNTQPALPKPAKSKGGQVDHQGKTLERIKNPDHIAVHLPKTCQCCQRVFDSSDNYLIVKSCQVFDLPRPKLDVTEHQVGQITCCGLVQTGQLPAHVTAPVQYGSGVKALVSMLSVNYRMPLQQIGQLFNDLYGYNLNDSTALTILEQAYQLMEPLEVQIEQHLLAQPLAHSDETGIRVANKLHWLHTLTTNDCTHLWVHEKRGQLAMLSEESVLKDFKGILVHDCWASYFNLDSATHALCGAHLLRELNGLQENGSQWAKQMHTFLLDLYHQPLPIIGKEQQKTFIAHYQKILAQADAEEPPPIQGKRGKPKRSKGRNLMERFKVHQDSVLAFAFVPGVPFTNNQAERDLRNVKVKLKVSGCFRTLQGAKVYARLQAVMSTFRKRQMSVFEHLYSLFSLSTPIAFVWEGK